MTDDEQSQLETALDVAREQAETEWKQTSITEEIEVVIPIDMGPELRDSAEVTWEQADADDYPRRHRECPERSLKEYVAETVATDQFLERHDVKRSNVDAIARTRGRTRVMRQDGELHATGEVWEVVVRV